MEPMTLNLKLQQKGTYFMQFQTVAHYLENIAVLLKKLRIKTLKLIFGFKRIYGDFA